MVSHWLQFKTDEPFVPDLDKFGFVYLITNTKTRKKYVGCKQYYIGKAKTASKWETYMGSSKYLKEDIKKRGKKHFRFEVIAEYINKRSLRYYEAYYQLKWNVLASVIEGTDEPAFYNSYVGGKFYRPVESYQDPEFKRKISEAHKGKKVTEETRKKLSEATLGDKHHMFGKKHTEETKRKMSEANSGLKHPNYKGKVEFYLDNKRMIVKCLSLWCRENGYSLQNLCGIIKTERDGFFVDNQQKNGKNRRLSCKGPLGIITKVKWLGKEETNGD